MLFFGCFCRTFGMKEFGTLKVEAERHSQNVHVRITLSASFDTGVVV